MCRKGWNWDFFSEGSTTTDQELLNCRAGYNAAISLWTYQGNQVTQRTRMMFLANSAIIAVIGLRQTPSQVNQTLGLALPVVGLVLCAFWFFWIKRETEFADYFIKCSRAMEHHLGPVRIVSNGMCVAKGLQVAVDGQEDFRLSTMANQFRAQTIFVCLPMLYLLLYLLLIWVQTVGLPNPQL